MKRLFALLIILPLLLNLSYAAPQKKPASAKIKSKKVKAKPEPKAKPRLVQPLPPAEPTEKGITVSTGAMGGTWSLGLGYTRKVYPAADVRGEVNFGSNFGLQGLNYTLLSGRISAIFRIGTPYFAVLSVDAGNYSNRVEQLFVVGTVSRGTVVGLGASVGMVSSPFEMQVGLSSALALYASLGYRF